MLEYFRKYSLLAFIVLILLFFGLIFMVDGVGSAGVGSGPKRLSYDGKDYTLSQVERQGQEYGSMLITLLEPGRTSAFMDLMPYLQSMQVSPQGFIPEDYLANRLLLENLMEKYGVKPDQEQIENFITGTIFTDQNGEFDQSGYLEFIEKRVKRLGLGVQDFNILMGEVIAVSKLKEIIGKGYSLDPEVTRKALKVTQQEMTYEQFSLPIAKLRDSIEVSPEDLKAYWEENKTKYMSDPQIKVQYAISDANLLVYEGLGKESAEVLARKEGKTEEEIEKMEYTLPAEEKSKMINKALTQIDNLFIRVQDAEGKGFTEMATEMGLKLQTTDFFTEKAAPFDLKLPLYKSQGSVVGNLMGLSAGTESMDSISDVLTIGEGRFLIAQVLERKDAEPLPFEQAEARAKIDLIDDRAKNSLGEEVGKVREKLVAGADSKPMDKLAKELNLLYFKHDNMTVRSQINGDPSAGEMFMEAMQLEEKAFSEPIIQTEGSLNRALIVRPLERKYVTSEENKAALESQLDNSGEMMGNMVFSNWFTQQLSQVEVEKFQ